MMQIPTPNDAFFLYSTKIPKRYPRPLIFKLQGHSLFTSYLLSFAFFPFSPRRDETRLTRSTRLVDLCRAHRKSGSEGGGICYLSGLDAGRVGIFDALLDALLMCSWVDALRFFSRDSLFLVFVLVLVLVLVSSSRFSDLGLDWPLMFFFLFFFFFFFHLRLLANEHSRSGHEMKHELGGQGT